MSWLSDAWDYVTEAAPDVAGSAASEGGFPWSTLITSAIPSVVGGVGDYLTQDDQRQYDEELLQKEWEREDRIRAENLARQDKNQALSLQLEAIKAKYQTNPYLSQMILSPGEALATKSRDSDRKQQAINSLISAIQNPLLSRA